MTDEAELGQLLRRLAGSPADAAPVRGAVPPSAGRRPDMQPVGTASQRRDSLRPGQAFAHYQLQKELGRGAMATVYRALNERDGRTVALKVLTLGDDWPEDRLAEARLRLLREAEAASRIDHPDIVRVFESGDCGGQVYLAMEYVEGVNLATHAGEGRQLPPRMVCEMCARVAEALHFAHQRGIVHRDIKPANIIFDQANRRVRIMDFGVARFVDSAATRTGIVLGSPSYMAPEQLEGGKVDGRADQFSLGVTLFQLLTGVLPFRSDSIPGLMHKIMNDAHPPLATIRPDLPECLRAIVDRALHKDPDLRYGTALELAISLRDCGRTIPATLR